MESRSFTGDDDREFGPVPTCPFCGCDLYPDEVPLDRCRRCAKDAYEAEQIAREVA